jgi:Ca2+-dependent lipid-binding protein
MPSLTVTVVNGKDLVVRDKDTSDPYVKLRVGLDGDWTKTKVVRNSLDPEYNEKFTLHVSDPSKQHLYIEIWDSDMLSKDDFMGRGEVIIEHLKHKKTTKLTISLKDVETGSITVVLQADDFGSDI